MDDAQTDRGSMTVRRFGSNAEADAADLAYWRALSPDERLRQVWVLTQAQWRLAGRDAPGLSRSVTRIRRS